MSEEPPEKKQKGDTPSNGTTETPPQSAGPEHGGYPYWGPYSVSYIFLAVI